MTSRAHPMEWTLALAASILLAAGAARAAEPLAEPYQEIRVSLPSGSPPAWLLDHPDLEVMGLGDRDLRLLSRPSITRTLRGKGVDVEILHEDLEAHYAEINGKRLDYGVWHDYEETIQELNDLHIDFPAITTAPFAIGSSVEGRAILVIKISDNPEEDEEEPEVLIDGVHHAREIMSLELNLFFARYLCEHYGLDPLVTELVDNREIFILPLLNPDGFVYNQVRNPGGGGMWRKNRRPGTVCFGVDLNRNYPFRWGEQGASADPCSDTYRGTSPASEPETAAITSFLLSRKIVTHDSIHSVAGMILFPWGYTREHTPDDRIFRSVAGQRIVENGYAIGQAPELLYLVSGSAGDWAYGEETEKRKIYSFTTEVGGTGFWPNPAEREPLLQENLASLLTLARVAGRSISWEDLIVEDSGGDGRLDPGDAASLVAVLASQGLAPIEGELRLRLACDDPYVRIEKALARIDSLPFDAPGGNHDDPLRVRIDRSCPEGRRVTLTFRIEGAADRPREVPVIVTIGRPAAIVANEFENPGDEWSVSEGVTASEGRFERIDPNGTAYQPEDDTTPHPGVHAWVTGQNEDEGRGDVDGGSWFSLSPAYDLSGYRRVRLSVNYFHGQRDSGDDPQGDWFRIDVLPGPSPPWINLVSIEDQASEPSWRNLTVDLEEIIDLGPEVRFRVGVSDGPLDSDIIEGGIDDFFLSEPGAGDRLPSEPIPVEPEEGATGLGPWVRLGVQNANDPEGESLAYGFRLFADSLLTRLVAETEGIPEGSNGVTAWLVPISLPIGTYYWRAYAADLEQRGLYGPVRRFAVTESAGAPPPPLLAYPNPTRGRLGIRFFVPETTTSRLEIYGPSGRLVRRLPVRPSAAGWQEVPWDGRDGRGAAAAEGTYWVRLWTPLETRTVRVVKIAEDATGE